MEANQKLTQFMEAINRSTAAEISRAETEAGQEAEQILRVSENKTMYVGEKAGKGASEMADCKRLWCQPAYQGCSHCKWKRGCIFTDTQRSKPSECRLYCTVVRIWYLHRRCMINRPCPPLCSLGFFIVQEVSGAFNKQEL